MSEEIHRQPVEVPSIGPKHYNYSHSGETPPEDVYADYKEAYAAHDAAHTTTTKIAQGGKYVDTSLGPMDMWSSRDDLNKAVGAQGQAAQNLYEQDSASRGYAQKNLDTLIPQAKHEMDQAQGKDS